LLACEQNPTTEQHRVERVLRADGRGEREQRA
jgi:hypothetical protein